jgi:hypothetical protein
MKLAFLRDEVGIRKMAEDLRRLDAAANDSDAIRCLMGRGFPSIQVALFRHEARALALAAEAAE